MRRLVLVFIVGLLSLTGLVAPAAAADDQAAGADIATASRLYVVNGQAGTLVPRGKDRYDLTLRPVDRTVTWFTDRPARGAGTLGMAALVRDWERLGFAADPPNAAIELAGGASDSDTLAVELSRPRYDAATRTLRLRARRIEADSVGGHGTTDRRVPRRFGRVSLFIDDASPTAQITMTNTSPYTMHIDCGEYDLVWVKPNETKTGYAPAANCRYVVIGILNGLKDTMAFLWRPPYVQPILGAREWPLFKFSAVAGPTNAQGPTMSITVS